VAVNLEIRGCGVGKWRKGKERLSDGILELGRFGLRIILPQLGSDDSVFQVVC
jgi:hypothetical protein